MVYCVDDPIAAKQLEDAGAVAVMPLGGTDRLSQAGDPATA